MLGSEGAVDEDDVSSDEDSGAAIEAMLNSRAVDSDVQSIRSDRSSDSNQSSINTSILEDLLRSESGSILTHLSHEFQEDTGGESKASNCGTVSRFSPLRCFSLNESLYLASGI